MKALIGRDGPYTGWLLELESQIGIKTIIYGLSHNPFQL